MAASTTAVAGALSMGAGAFLALSSEQEIRSTDALKRQFLQDAPDTSEEAEHPLPSALIVGGSYLVGALVPVLPVLFGAHDARASVIMAGVVIVLVSTVLAFLSGMNVRRRIRLNLVIMAVAVRSPM